MFFSCTFCFDILWYSHPKMKKGWILLFLPVDCLNLFPFSVLVFGYTRIEKKISIDQEAKTLIRRTTTTAHLLPPTSLLLTTRTRLHPFDVLRQAESTGDLVLCWGAKTWINTGTLWGQMLIINPVQCVTYKLFFGFLLMLT